MPITTETDVRVRFRAPTVLGDYSSALYYPLGEVPDVATIKADAQALADGYVADMQNPPLPAPHPAWEVTTEDGTGVFA